MTWSSTQKTPGSLQKTSKLSLTRSEDVRATCKNQPHFYILTRNMETKIKNTTIYNCYNGNHIPRHKLNKTCIGSVRRKHQNANKRNQREPK